MARIVIIGGSYAGMSVYQNLLGQFKKQPEAIQVTLIEKRDQFQHTTGNTRSLVDTEFAKASFLPYAKAFTGKNKFVKGEVVAVYKDKVVLADGQEIAFDYLVVATGVAIPAPFRPVATAQSEGVSEFKAYSDAIKSAKSILLVGGGPVNVETAGEILDHFPDKKITLVSAGPTLVGAGTWLPKKFSDGLISKLEKKGVKVILNEKIDLESNNLTNGISATPRSITTATGKSLSSDLQIVSVGGYAPISRFLSTLGAGVLDSKGFVVVEPTLQVKGFKNIFALGDVAAAGAPKMAFAANVQSGFVGGNIKALITAPKSTTPALKSYDFNKGMKGMLVTIGKNDGSAYMGMVMGAWMVKMMKGKDMMLGPWQKAFN